jgi:hypothetical protein
MNLRASHGGKDIVLPLDDHEWEELQQRLRSKVIELTMPCCNGPAYMRVSPAGTQHFVHQIDIGCKQSESEVHQLAKLEIVRACRELKIEAIPEYEGDGWRADVLVKHAKCDGVSSRFRSAHRPSKKLFGGNRPTGTLTSVAAGSSLLFPSARHSDTSSSHCCLSMQPRCSSCTTVNRTQARLPSR